MKTDNDARRLFAVFGELMIILGLGLIMWYILGRIGWIEPNRENCAIALLSAVILGYLSNKLQRESNDN